MKIQSDRWVESGLKLGLAQRLGHFLPQPKAPAEREELADCGGGPADRALPAVPGVMGRCGDPVFQQRGRGGGGRHDDPIFQWRV
jgi:hypothetical protein